MQSKRLLPEAKVRERYGVSSMTLWRWDQTPSLNFPPAIRINKRKYRDAAELDAFDAAQRAKAVGWVEDEVAAHNEAKIAARDNGGA